MIRGGKIEFTLPPSTVPDSHFELIWRNGFPIMVEVDQDGNPFQWNTLDSGMQLLVGAELPMPTITIGMTAEMTKIDCNRITMTDVSRLTADSLQHYQDIGLIDVNGQATENAYKFYLTGGGIQRDATVPWSWAELTVKITDPSAITCNIIDGNLAITIPMRAPGSNRVIPLTFMLDQEGMENWYGPAGVNRPDVLEKRNSQQTFADILTNIRSGKPFGVVFRPWIPSPSTDNPELMDQWKASKELLDMFNTQAPFNQPRNPTVQEVPTLKTMELFVLFILPDDIVGLTPELKQAIADELVKRNPVFPVEILGN